MLPIINVYWDHWPYFICLPLFPPMYGKDKFFHYFHLSPNPKPDGPKPTDHLYKVRPPLQYFHGKREQIVTPEKEFCIDESMLFGGVGSSLDII